MSKQKEIAINRIKAVLAEKNVRQDELAKHLGKAKTTVSTYCTNTNQPSLHTLREIAIYLKVDIRDLLISIAAE